MTTQQIHTQLLSIGAHESEAESLTDAMYRNGWTRQDARNDKALALPMSVWLNDLHQEIMLASINATMRRR